MILEQNVQSTLSIIFIVLLYDINANSSLIFIGEIIDKDWTQLNYIWNMFIISFTIVGKSNIYNLKR